MLACLFFISPPLHENDGYMTFCTRHDRNRIGGFAYKSTRITSAWHWVSVKHACGCSWSLFIYLFIYCCGIHHAVTDKHRRRSMRISSPVRVYTCQQTQTRMWLMFRELFLIFWGGVSVKWLSHCSAMPFTEPPEIDSRLLIHFRRRSSRVFVYPFLHSHILVSRIIKWKHRTGPLSYQLIMGLM